MQSPSLKLENNNIATIKIKYIIRPIAFGIA